MPFEPLDRQFSPHARGWPERSAEARARLCVLPARAGMARSGRRPRSWRFEVLPARAGMALKGGFLNLPQPRSPRTRGDGPVLPAPDGPKIAVLPARAGMARRPMSHPLSPAAFSPHARGWPGHHAGVSGPQVGSPRTRGDGPRTRKPARIPTAVLPARAGMARLSPLPWLVAPGSPRTRGDGPVGQAGGWFLDLRSPRTRGDGPHTKHAATSSNGAFSPHARGWPGGAAVSTLLTRVLPARAGMAQKLAGRLADLPEVLPARAGMARDAAGHR